MKRRSALEKEDIKDSSFVYKVELNGGGNIYFTDEEEARNTAKKFKSKFIKLVDTNRTNEINSKS